MEETEVVAVNYRQRQSIEGALEQVQSTLEHAPTHNPYQTIVNTETLLAIKSDLEDALTNDHVTWRVGCQHCDWMLEDLDSRRAAILSGHTHVDIEHNGESEWEFRVQKISR